MLSSSERLKFDALVREISLSGHDEAGIGTYKEKSLHYILKNYFCSDRSCHERSYMGYIADIMEDGYITEIQSSSLYGMGQKLETFLSETDVRIVFPIVKKNTIVWVDSESGSITRSSRSAKRDDIYTLIRQLVYILEYLGHERLKITTVTLHTDDYRLLDGRGADRKKGATKLDLVPTELVDIEDLTFPDSLARFVPSKLPEFFTREEFASATHTHGRALWAVLRVMTELSVIERAPNDGRRHRYTRNVTYFT